MPCCFWPVAAYLFGGLTGSDRIQIKIKTLDGNEIIVVVVAIIQPLIEEKEQSPVVAVDPAVSKVLDDRDRLAQELTNCPRIQVL